MVWRTCGRVRWVSTDVSVLLLPRKPQMDGSSNFVPLRPEEGKEGRDRSETVLRVVKCPFIVSSSSFYKAALSEVSEEVLSSRDPWMQAPGIGMRKQNETKQKKAAWSVRGSEFLTAILFRNSNVLAVSQLYNCPWLSLRNQTQVFLARKQIPYSWFIGLIPSATVIPLFYVTHHIHRFLFRIQTPLGAH